MSICVESMNDESSLTLYERVIAVMRGWIERLLFIEYEHVLCEVWEVHLKWLCRLTSMVSMPNDEDLEIQEATDEIMDVLAGMANFIGYAWRSEWLVRHVGRVRYMEATGNEGLIVYRRMGPTFWCPLQGSWVVTVSWPKECLTRKWIGSYRLWNVLFALCIWRVKETVLYLPCCL